jgi:hypothetical protein
MPAWLIALLPDLVALIEKLLGEAKTSSAAQDHPKTAAVLGVIGQVAAIVGPAVVASVTHAPVATPGGGQGAPIQ